MQDEDHEGRTPITVALTTKQNVVVDLMINRGFNVKMYRYHGLTLLHVATSVLDRTAMQKMIAYGFPVHATGNDGRTVLDLANVLISFSFEDEEPALPDHHETARATV